MKWFVILISILMLSLVFACSDDETVTDPGLSCTEDEYEPNDSEDEFYNLGSITDCNGDSISILATICPDDDEDWFRVVISETDVIGCVLDPHVFIRLPDGITCTVAAYYQCIGSTDTFADSITVTGKGGLVIGDINCTGVINNSGYFRVRVRRVSGSSKETYSLMIRG